MCILFIFVDTNPKKGSYRLIIASNRDEYYRRPADIARFFPNDNIIAGRDMEIGREGGTWLGISLKKSENFKFRFGALLNITGEDRKEHAKGRGNIVMDYIKDDLTGAEYVDKLYSDDTHNAFNFVAVELREDSASTFHLSNSPPHIGEFQGTKTLGFGNSPLNSPLTKVKNGTTRFSEIISKYNSTEHGEQLKDELISLLKWEERHLPDPELQKRAPNAYEELSSVFVKIQNSYGTRTHSIVLVTDDWKVEFIEETIEEPYNPQEPVWNKQTIKSNL